MAQRNIDGFALFPVSELLELADLPFANLPDAFAEDLFFTEASGSFDGENFHASFLLATPPQEAKPLPGVDIFAVRLGPGDDWLVTHVECTLGPDFDVRFEGISLALQIRTEWLKPVGEFPNREPLDQYLELQLEGNIGIRFDDSRFHVSASLSNAVSLPRTLIGDTGLIVSADGLSISGPAGRNGFYADRVMVEMPPDIAGLPDVILSEFLLSSAGVSGNVTLRWDAALLEQGGRTVIDDANSDVVGSLFGDSFRIAPRSLTLSLHENSIEEFSINCLLEFPDSVFSNTLEATLRIGGNGQIEVTIASPAGILTLEKEDFLRIEVLSLGFKHTAEETAVSMDGAIELLEPSIAKYVPKLEVQGFTIYREAGASWGLRIEGAKANVNKSIDLFGVARVDIEEIGIAIRDDCPSILFTGGAHILEGIDVAASVDGLRVPLCSGGSLKLDGLGIRAVVPGSFEFEGFAARRTEGDSTYFEGDIALTIIPIGLGIAAGLKIGKNDQCRFAFLSAELTLPAPGIPLLSLPLYLSKIKGLVGVNMALDADSVQQLVPLLEKQPVGLSDVTKWRDECGSHAVGFGIGVSTANRKLFNAEALLAFTYPELLLIIEGKAFVLRAPKPGARPPFTCLIALDLDEPATLINIGAQFEFIKGVLAADAVVEAYIGPDPDSNRTLAYFALGKDEPFFAVSRRVSAKVLQLFTASSFLYIGTNAFALVFEIGFPKKTYGFSFARVHFEALIRGGGLMYYDPAQFQGDFLMTGSVGFRVFRIGFDLSLGASVLGRTPDWLVDAKIWFGIKFKIIFKTIKIGGTIPFKWERRTVPPIPELLDELLLKHAIYEQTTPPLILQCDDTNPQAVPKPDVVPIVEPGATPTMTFRYAVKDVTGLPFGQDVGLVAPHQSDDYEFHPELLDVRFSRLRIKDWLVISAGFAAGNTNWEDFEVQFGEGGFFAYRERPAPKPLLYGAWQATEDADGTPRATELHLFARSPFDYARSVHLTATDSMQLFDPGLVAVGSRFASGFSTGVGENVFSAVAQSRLRADGVRIDPLPGETDEATSAVAAIDVPVVGVVLKSDDDLRNQQGLLPNRPLQQLVNEGRVDLGFEAYPRSGVGGYNQDGDPKPLEIVSISKCLNFLNSSPGGLREDQLFRFDEDAVAQEGQVAGSVLIGGRITGRVSGTGESNLGSLEVVHDGSVPYPMQYLSVHNDRGFVAGDDANDQNVEKPVTQPRDNKLRMMFRQPVRRLTVHFETIYDQQSLPTHQEAVLGRRCGGHARMRSSSSRPLKNDGLKFSSAFRTDYSASGFWDRAASIRRISQDATTFGLLDIESPSDSFNGVEFSVGATVRVYSICLEFDMTEELGRKDKALDEYMGILWPGPRDDTGSGQSWPDDPGPARLDGITMRSPEGGVQPGYIYRLQVATSNTRSGRSEAGPIRKNYCAYYQVPFPPSNLGPYVVETLPNDQFPLYRASGYFLRTGMNFVHKLMGDQNSGIRVEILADGEIVASQPFVDEPPDMARFIENTDRDRRGWNWGKAGDGHRETTEEEIWRNAFNLSIPDGATPISPEMALPDDVLWSYSPNPILMREEFDSVQALTSGFLSARTLSGQAINGRWQVRSSQLHHGTEDEVQSDGSVLLSSDEIDESFSLSIWVRPNSQSESSQTFAIVLCAGVSEDGAVTSYLAVEFDGDENRTRLIQSSPDAASENRTKVAGAFEIPVDRWTKLQIRAVLVRGSVVVSLVNGADVVFSVETDFDLVTGRVGILASPDFLGQFDNFEVVSLTRLSELPRGGRPHKLRVRYRETDVVQPEEEETSSGPANIVTSQGTEFDMYDLDFRASQYLDLFDHLNAWNRVVGRGPMTDSSTSSAQLLVDQWVEANTVFIQALSRLSHAKREVVMKRANLEELETDRRVLRDARFALDEAFEKTAQHMGIVLPPQPDKFEFSVSGNSQCLLVQTPEPIDWTTIGAGPIRKLSANSQDSEIHDTRFLYSSDLTRAMIIIESSDRAILPFEGGATYVWTLNEFDQVPEHISWLRGWVNHFARSHNLTLEIPQIGAPN